MCGCARAMRNGITQRKLESMAVTNEYLYLLDIRSSRYRYEVAAWLTDRRIHQPRPGWASSWPWPVDEPR